LGQLVELVMIRKVIVRSNCNQNLISGLPCNCTCMFKRYTHAESIFVLLKIPNPEVRKYSRRLEQFESSSSVELSVCLSRENHGTCFRYETVSCFMVIFFAPKCIKFVYYQNACYNNTQ
jgi:hypothetical protein